MSLVTILVVFHESRSLAQNACAPLFQKSDESIGRELKRYFSQDSLMRANNKMVYRYKNNRMHLTEATYSAASMLSGEINVHLLKKGDRITFEDGRTVTLGKFLGAGNSTQIFAIQEDPKWVVGIPTPAIGRSHETVLHDYKSYAESAKSAAAAGYSMIKIRIRDGIIFREKLEPFQSLRDFAEEVSQMRRESDLNAEQKKKLNAALALVEFLKGRTDFLTDLNTYQIAWRNDRWIFFDFLDFGTGLALERNGFSPDYGALSYSILRGLVQFPSIKSSFKTYGFTN
jgi:hypothetical protein